MTPADCVLEIEFHGASSEQGAGSILNNWNRSDKNPQREVRVRENCSTWNNSPCVRLTFVRVPCAELQRTMRQSWSVLTNRHLGSPSKTRVVLGSVS